MIPLQILILAVLPFAALAAVRRGRMRTHKGIQPLDIGLFFASVVALYGILPLAGIYLAYAGFGAIADDRFGGALPDETAVIAVGWMYALFLAGFVVAYAWLHSPRRSSRTNQLVVPVARDVVKSIGLFVFIHVTIVGIRLMYGVGSGEDYLDSYAVVRDQPLIVQQVLGLLAASHLAAAILVIVSTIAWRPRWHPLTVLLVLALVADTFLTGGSRRDAFLCALAYLVARSVYGPRVRPGTVVVLGALGVAVFTLAGMVRQGSLGAEQSPAIPMLQDGEFTMFFGNALDLLDKSDRIKSPEVSTALYLVDLLRLVPRQIIGDFKVDPATLYASTLHPEFYEAGGAFAFGAMAESALGFGGAEALVRGLILGSAYALVRRLLQRKSVGLLRVFVYVWFVTLAYEGLRDTTLTLFPRFVMQMVPILLIARMMGICLRTRRRLPLHGNSTPATGVSDLHPSSPGT